MQRDDADNVRRKDDWRGEVGEGETRQEVDTVGTNVCD